MYRILFFVFIALQFHKQTLAQIPILNSMPSANHIIYLDFDGHTTIGANWNVSYNSGNPIVSAPSSFSPSDITEIFNQVAEDFIPFQLNVTTDSNVFNSAPMMQKVRVVISPTIAWYGGSVGGVANLYTFSSPVNNVCFVFENNLSGNTSFVAEACSHEAGHTFGLNHHSSFNNACVNVSQYNGGYGSGEISWAPIMGNSYSKNQTTWSNIPANGSCAVSQNDLAIITSSNNNGLTFKTDDHSNTALSATLLNFVSGIATDSGIIHQQTDEDYFKIILTAPKQISVKANPYNIGASNRKANLDIQLSIVNNAGVLLAQSANTQILNASIDDILLQAGTYYIKVNGELNENNNGFGSLGRYYLQVTDSAIISNNVSANFVANKTTLCPNGTTIFTDQSTGNNTSWVWSFAGGTPSSFVGQNPGAITYATSGTYTVTLTVSDGTTTNTKSINYITVANTPLVYIAPPNSVACGGASKFLWASGGHTYSWASSLGLSNTFLEGVNATVNTNTAYTVTSISVEGCTNTFVANIYAYANPILTKYPAGNATIITCLTDTIMMAVSGANTYLWSPIAGLNNATADSVKASFATIGNKNFSVQGTDVNGCKANASFNILVRKCDSLGTEIQASRTGLCIGDTVQYSDFSTGYPTSWAWTFAGANTSTSVAKNPTNIIYNTAGLYPVTLTITDSVGNTATRTYNNLISVAAYPALTITPQIASICVGDSINLTPSNAQFYTWDFDNTLTNLASGIVKVKPTNTKIYYVTGRNNANGGYMPNYNGGGSGGGGNISTNYKACTTKDSATITAVVCAPLAINSILLQGSIINHNAILQYTFVEPSNILEIEIQKSLDGVQFETIKKIIPNTAIHEYYFVDDANNNYLPASYYRIKASTNTATLFSNTIQLNDNINKYFWIWPNPVSDIIQVQVYSAVNEMVTINMINSLGKIVCQKQVYFHIGNNKIEISTVNFTNGVYQISIVKRNGVATKTFLKQ